MSKAWVTCWYCLVGSPLFSRPGVRPHVSRPAVTSNSLPKPHVADLLAGELARVGDAGVLPGHRQRARALEDLGDVDEVRGRRRLARLEDLRHPADRELGAVGLGALDLGHDVRAARDHRDRQVLGLEVALLVGREVAGELGLRRPLELEPDAGRGRRRAGRRLRAGSADAPLDGATLAGVWDAGGVDAAGVHAAKTITAAAVSANPRFLSMDSSCLAPGPAGARFLDRRFRRRGGRIRPRSRLGRADPVGRLESVSSPRASWPCHGMTRRSSDAPRSGRTRCRSRRRAGSPPR